MMRSGSTNKWLLSLERANFGILRQPRAPETKNLHNDPTMTLWFKKLVKVVNFNRSGQNRISQIALSRWSMAKDDHDDDADSNAVAPS
jgi:hypothetical protein